MGSCIRIVFPEAQIILDKFTQNPENEYALLTDTEDIMIEVQPYAGRRFKKSHLL